MQGQNEILGVQK